MKKVLLTSTALVAFAGAAAAEVTLSGSAEMGVQGRGGDIDYSTQFVQSVDVRFSLSGETDNGLTFGAVIDLDDALDMANNGTDIIDETGFSDFVVFVSGEFGTVTMGDTDGALDWAMTDAASIGNPGSIDDSETAHFGRQDTYLDGVYDGQILRYDYTYQDFSFAVSVEQDDTYDTDNDYNWALGVKWEGEAGPGMIKLGAGYQAADQGAVSFGSDDVNISIAFGEDASVWGISAGYYMDNGFSFGGTYSGWDGDNLEDGSHWAIGAGYSFDAFSFHANYGEHSFEGQNGYELDTEGWGLAAGYDLGGGLSVLAGYGNSHADDSDGDEYDWDSWSLGLSMSF